MSVALSSRYARALADIAFAPGSAEDADGLLQEMRRFAGELDGVADLRRVLSSPAVARKKKHDVIEKIAERMSLSKTMRSFLSVVSSRGRLNLLHSIADAYQREMDARRGIAAADVTSAVELTGEQRAAFESQVAALTGKKARLEFQVDPSILGGAILRIGSSVYDGSVAGQLRKVSAKLAAGA